MITKLLSKMIEYEKGSPKRVNHFLKVYSFANLISENENISEELKLIISVSAIVHDIGIKVSLDKYGSSSGKYQQIEGPIIAEKMLQELGYTQSIINRVCFLIANHHTYENIDGIDYQILIEADFLVNIFEDDLNKEKVSDIKTKYFKTNYGKHLVDTLYLHKGEWHNINA